MRRFLMTGIIALAAMIAMPTAASAAPFTGQLDYTGSQTSDDANLNVATQSTINFAFVVVSTEAFLAGGINPGDSLNHASPLVYRPSGAPYSPLWTHVASGISFTLSTMMISSSSADSLFLVGSGVFSGGGFDDTPGVWNMTLNNQGDVIGSFSSSSITRPVPEPAMLALFGFGLAAAGTAAARRRRQS